MIAAIILYLTGAIGLTFVCLLHSKDGRADSYDFACSILWPFVIWIIIAMLAYETAVEQYGKWKSK